MLIKHHTTVHSIEQTTDRMVIRYIDGTAYDCAKDGEDLNVCFINSEGTVISSETLYGYYQKGKA